MMTHIIPLLMKSGHIKQLKIEPAETGNPYAVTMKLPRGCGNKVTLPITFFRDMAKYLDGEPMGTN